MPPNSANKPQGKAADSPVWARIEELGRRTAEKVGKDGQGIMPASLAQQGELEVVTSG